MKHQGLGRQDVCGRIQRFRDRNASRKTKLVTLARYNRFYKPAGHLTTTLFLGKKELIFEQGVFDRQECIPATEIRIAARLHHPVQSAAVLACSNEIV